MKNWLILAAVVVAFAVPSEAEAHWRHRRYRTAYGYGRPVHTAHYQAPYYVTHRSVVVQYRPVVVRPVVIYRPVAYSAYYAPAPRYNCGW